VISEEADIWHLWHISKVIYPLSTVSIWKYFKSSNHYIFVTGITIFICRCVLLETWLCVWGTVHNYAISIGYEFIYSTSLLCQTKENYALSRNILTSILLWIH